MEDEAKEFNKLHEEWETYHAGKVAHPTKNEEVSKLELRTFELSQLVEKEFSKLKDKFGEKRPSSKDLHEHVYNLAEKSYMASIGAKDKKHLDKDVLKQNVDEYVINLASQAAGRKISSVKEAMETILEAPDPIYGTKEEDRSAILDQLIQQYASSTHKSTHKDTKGQSASRLSYLERELSREHYTEKWKGKHGNIFEKVGRPGYKFDDTAKAGDIMFITSQALNYDRLGGHAVRRKYIKKPEGPLKETAPYKKAA